VSDITLPRAVVEEVRSAIRGFYNKYSDEAVHEDAGRAIAALDAALAEPDKVQPHIPVQTGWLCPACGRGNAPLAQTCPCKGYGAVRVGYGNAYMIGGTCHEPHHPAPRCG
jgi:hypothetical protein